jgi:hypothetical protein
MASVSVCPAACGRVCGRASLALQKQEKPGTRHQITQQVNVSGRQRRRLSQLSQFKRVLVGQKNLMKSTVSQLSHLSQSKNREPEPSTKPNARQNRAVWLNLGWLGTPLSRFFQAALKCG